MAIWSLILNESNMHKYLLAATVAALSLYGCSRDTQDWSSTPSAASAPQATPQSSDVSPWLWGLGGFMAGRMTAPSPTTVYQPPPVVNNTTIVQRPIYTPPKVEKPLVAPPKPYVAPPPGPRPTYTAPAPTYRPSFSSPSRPVITRSR